MVDHQQGPGTDGRLGDPDDPTFGFFGRLAHDLRGPLSPLQTAAYLLRRDDLDPDRKEELLRIIDRQTNRLSSMVQEVSDWMRARESRLVSRLDAVNVPMLLDLAAANLGSGTVLEPPSSDLDDAWIEADPQRLLQVLRTVVEFLGTRASPVRLRVEGDGDGVVFLAVADGGRWKDADERCGLFDEPQAAPFDEGLGMRLLVARAIATAHGGTLDAIETANGDAGVRLAVPRAPGP